MDKIEKIKVLQECVKEAEQAVKWVTIYPASYGGDDIIDKKKS